MTTYKLPNANAGVITVTSTATLLKNLINTAGSTSAIFPGDLSAVDLYMEDNDIRVFYDGNTPTASKGILLKGGTTYRFRGVDFHSFRLIRAGSSNALVSVTIGFADGEDLENSSAGGGSSSGGASTADGSAFTTDSTAGTIAMGVYKSSADTIADGDAAAVAIDVNRNLKVSLATLLGGEDLTNNVLGVIQKPIAASTYSLSRSAIFGTDVDVSAKAAAGNVFSIHATNINAAVRYFQIFNKASAPAGADVPVFSFPIPAGTAAQPGQIVIGEDFFGPAGYHLSTGVAYGVSTTNATFTAATTTDHNEHVMYI